MSLTEIFRFLGLGPEHADRFRQLQDGLAVTDALTPLDADLLRAGLLVEARADGGLRPVPLRLAVEHHVAELHTRADAARAAASAMDDLMRAASGPMCETVGHAAAEQALRDIQLNAQDRLRSFDRGPYFSSPDGQLSDVQEQVTARGVRYSTIIEQRALSTTGSLAAVRDGIATGEVFRVIANLPLRLSIADDRLALVMLPRAPSTPGAEPTGVDVLLVYPSALLDGLINMFTAYWHLAVPLDLGPDEGEEVDDGRFLQLMASGLTDAAIAGHLGVSARTVQRRLGNLQQRVGASSRFQLGVQAVRLGLLDIDRAAPS